MTQAHERFIPGYLDTLYQNGYVTKILAPKTKLPEVDPNYTMKVKTCYTPRADAKRQ